MKNKYLPYCFIILLLTIAIILPCELYSQKVNKLDSGTYQEIKDGLANSYLKFTNDKTGRVAFMGGSITQNPGWRELICKYLSERFSETKFDFINAGIGSTGSTPGAFRLASDVLEKGEIDLLFEEAAVNDRTNSFDSTECIRGMEGIVAHAGKAEPYLDIVLMYFVDPDKIKDYNNDRVPYEIRAHNKVARHYNLPTVNLAKEVTDRINNGEFSWEKDFVDAHPSPFGQELYYQSIRSFLENCWKKAENQPERLPHKLPVLIDNYSYVDARYVDIREAKPKEGWTFEENWSPSNTLILHKMCKNVPVLSSEKPGAMVEFCFKGRAVGICAVTGPDVGMIEYSIDHKYSGMVDLYTQWSNEYNLPWFVIFKDDLSDSNHSLKIKILKDKNPKSDGNAVRVLKFLVNK
jgi:sialidase-1